jgi:hypothetical protein
MAVAAIAVAASLALSGCSMKSTLDAKLAPKPTTVTVEATVAAVSAPLEGSVTDGFPDSVPLWPGAKVTKSKKTKTPQGTSYSVSMTTVDPFDNVVAGVGEGLKQAGWTVEVTDASTPEQKASILMVTSPDADGIVTIAQATETSVGIQYVVTPKK